MFSSKFDELDDLINDVCERCTGYLTPSKEEMVKILKMRELNVHFEENVDNVAANHHPKGTENLISMDAFQLRLLLLNVQTLMATCRDESPFIMFSTLTLPRLLNLPSIILNTLILILSGAKEHKQKTTFLLDLMKIAEKTNSSVQKPTISESFQKKTKNVAANKAFRGNSYYRVK